LSDSLPPLIPIWLARILAEPTCDIPDAGRALGLNRTAAYTAARRGAIETIETGPRRLRVPTPWLRRVLKLDELPLLRRTR
jgi:hypothetical protein